MDAQSWINFIQNVGFPIGMCVALFINMTKVQKELNESLGKTTEALVLLNERIHELEEKLDVRINSSTE